MRQWGWLELVKTYDIDIQCHPKKANLVADSLSRKTTHSSVLITREPRVQKDFEQAKITVAMEGIRAQLVQLTVQPTLRQRIIDAQVGDPILEKILNELATELVNEYLDLSIGRLLY